MSVRHRTSIHSKSAPRISNTSATRLRLIIFSEVKLIGLSLFRPKGFRPLPADRTVREPDYSSSTILTASSKSFSTSAPGLEVRQVTMIATIRLTIKPGMIS